MNKVAADIIRTALKLGGAVLVTSGVLPAQCTVTDPTFSLYAGLILAAFGSVWGVKAATGAENLAKAVDASPNLPPAKVVEKEGI